MLPKRAVWVELLKREGDNLGQIIASSSKKGGKRVLVFNDVVVNVSLRGWELCAISRRTA